VIGHALERSLPIARSQCRQAEAQAGGPAQLSRTPSEDPYTKIGFKITLLANDTISIQYSQLCSTFSLGVVVAPNIEHLLWQPKWFATTKHIERARDQRRGSLTAPIPHRAPSSFVTRRRLEVATSAPCRATASNLGAGCGASPWTQASRGSTRRLG
jgi:hypothetical protein